MKFFKAIGNEKSTEDDLTKAFLEIEEEETKTHKELDDMRGKVFNFHKAELAGNGNETELRKIEMIVISLQSKLETLAKLKDEIKRQIARKFEEDGIIRKEIILKTLEEIKIAKKENYFSILSARARISVLEWYQTGRPIQTPPYVDPEERDHFYTESDNIKKELNFSPNTKPLDSQKTSLLTELNTLGRQVVDSDFVEELIDQKRSEIQT